MEISFGSGKSYFLEHLMTLMIISDVTNSMSFGQQNVLPKYTYCIHSMYKYVNLIFSMRYQCLLQAIPLTVSGIFAFYFQHV